MGQGRLSVRRCNACGGRLYPIKERCRRCASTDLSWADPPLAGTIWSAIAVHRSTHPELVRLVPYAIGLVRLAPDLTVLAFLGDPRADPLPWKLDEPVVFDGPSSAARGALVFS